MEIEDVDAPLISMLARHIGQDELKSWGRLAWQVLQQGNRDVLDRLESVMRKRISN